MNDIPEGWVRVADYDNRAEDDHKSGPKGDYARILWQVRKHPGKAIRAYQSGSQWIACKADIDAFLRAFHESKDEKRVATAKPKPTPAVIDNRHAESVCESLASIDTTLDEIYRVLERLTAAVENIATQPKTPHQGLMASIGTNGNGFHQ